MVVVLTVLQGISIQSETADRHTKTSAALFYARCLAHMPLTAVLYLRHVRLRKALNARVMPLHWHASAASPTCLALVHIVTWQCAVLRHHHAAKVQATLIAAHVPQHLLILLVKQRLHLWLSGQVLLIVRCQTRACALVVAVVCYTSRAHGEHCWKTYSELTATSPRRKELHPMSVYSCGVACFSNP